MKKNFSKSDLQDGDKLTYRDGRTRTLFGNKLKEETSNGEFMNGNSLRNYNDELTDIDGNAALDIIKVERTKTKTIFERVEPIELVRGEIYCLEDEEDKWLFRFSKKNKNQVFSFFSTRL